MSLVPKDSILKIAPYIGGEGRAEPKQRPNNPLKRFVRLASNENPLGCSPSIHSAISEAIDFNRYPDGSSAELRKALGQHHGLPDDQIICGAGSDEIISLICRAFLSDGDEVIHSAHGFLMYALSTLAAGGSPVAVPETPDLMADPEAMLAAVTDRTRLVFLANPNNPTGSWWDRETLIRFRDALRDDVLLVIDGAYAEYMEGVEGYSDGANLVDGYPNVAVTKTFSKIYGLAALRLGWAYADPEIIDILNRVRGPFNVSSVAQTLGIKALKDQDFVRKSVQSNAENRTWLSEELQDLGLKIRPSGGNFLLAHIGEKAEAMRLALKAQGIFVRQMGAYGLPEYLRISIGTAEECWVLRDAVAAFRYASEIGG